MPHTNRHNFKAKWLEAKGTDASEYATDIGNATAQTDSIVASEGDVAMTLQRVHSTMMSTSLAAKELIDVLDDHIECAGIQFSPVGHIIDDSLNKLDLNTMARRFRDLYKIALMRVGLLSVALEEEHATSARFKRDLKKLSHSQMVLQRSAVESLYIGVNPTSNEIEDYPTKERSATDTRLNHQYYDLPDDFNIIRSESNGTNKVESQPVENTEVERRLTTRTPKTPRSRTHATPSVEFN